MAFHGNSSAPLLRGNHARPQAYGAAAMAAGRRRLPLLRTNRAFRPPDVVRARIHPFVCRTGTPAEFIRESGRTGPTPRRIPRIAGGRPFSADPVHEVARPFLTPRADPASPSRLTVYPRRDGGIVGMDREGGENRRAIFRQARALRADGSSGQARESASHPQGGCRRDASRDKADVSGLFRRPERRPFRRGPNLPESFRPRPGGEPSSLRESPPARRGRPRGRCRTA